MEGATNSSKSLEPVWYSSEATFFWLWLSEQFHRWSWNCFDKIFDKIVLPGTLKDYDVTNNPFFLFFLLLFYFPLLISRFSLTPSHKLHIYFSFLLFSSFILFSFSYLISLLRTTNRIVLRSGLSELSVTFRILAFGLFKSQTASISQKFKNSL
jgi:hypothetical protein